MYYYIYLPNNLFCSACRVTWAVFKGRGFLSDSCRNAVSGESVARCAARSSSRLHSPRALQPCRAAFYPRHTIITKVNALFFINQTQKAPRLHSSLSCCIILRILNELCLRAALAARSAKLIGEVTAVPMPRRNTKAACAYLILGHFRPSGPTFLPSHSRQLFKMVVSTLEI